MLRDFAIHPPRTSVFIGLTLALGLLIAIGCSSGGPDATAPATDTVESKPAVTSVDPAPAPTPTQLPTPTDVPGVSPAAVPTPTTVPVQVSSPEPTPTPSSLPSSSPTVAPTGVAVSPTPASTPTPLPSPTPTLIPTPVPLTNVYDAFGFSVELDQDASFQTSNLSVRGWTGDGADNEQGLMTFNYNGTNIVIFWQPDSGSSPQTAVDLTYQVQKLSNPHLNFVPISEGDLTVDGETGRFGGYLTAEGSGEGASGGLIGAWTCQGAGTQVSLTASGPDATALQIRFDRLTSGFKCATS